MATKQQLIEAKKLLEQHAPKGEFLAYINKDEAQVLKNLGGSGRIVEATQIPSFDVEETRVLPSPQLESALTPYIEKLRPLIGAQINTAAYDPQVAAQTQLQTGASQAAQGLGSLVGPDAYQQFMSPYQQQVMDTTLSEFDRQQTINQQGLRDQAIQAGAYGGGREGVMRSEYQSDSDMKRAQLQAQLLQSGFNQAQGQANTAFGQQGQLMAGANVLGADQQRMATLLPQLQGSDISTLGQAGRGQQLFEQSVLDQQREANRLAAYEPYERLGYMGAGMGNVMGGAMGQYQSQVTPNQSPLQQAMGIASLGLGAYKGFQNSNV